MTTNKHCSAATRLFLSALLGAGAAAPGALADQVLINIDGPSHVNVEVIGAVGTTDTGFGAGGDVIGDVSIMGSQAQGGFLEQNLGLKIFDVADPSNPEIQAIVAPPAETTNFLHTQLLDRDGDGTAEIAVVASQRSPAENRGARIYDISDPANPVEVHFFAVPGGGVHTLQRDPEDHNILFLNLTTTSLGADGTFPDSPGNTGGHVVILDMSDAADPQIVNVLRVDGWTSAADNPGERCHESMLFKHPTTGIKYLWCAYWSAGIVAFQVTDAAGNYLTGKTGEPDGPVQVARASYCTGRFGGPALAGSVDRPSCNTHNIIVAQNFIAYVGDEITNPPGGIHIVDVRDFDDGAAMREIAEVFPQNFGTGERTQPNLRESEAPVAHRLSAHNFYPNYDESLMTWAPYSAGVHVFDVSAMDPADTGIENFKWIAQWKPVQAFSADSGVEGTQGTPNTWTTRFGDDGGSIDQRGCIHVFDKVTGYYVLGMRAPGEAENSCVN
jgi:hypothetical protein